MNSPYDSPWPCLLFVTNGDGFITEVSSKLEEQWGRDGETCLSQLVVPDSPESISTHLRAPAGQITESRARLVLDPESPDRSRWYQLRSRRADRESSEVFFAAFEIDQQALAEEKILASIEEERLHYKDKENQLQRAEKARNQFLSNMSHELRTPLTAILGLSEALDLGLYGDVSEEQKEALQTINGCGKSLLGLINDILDVTKLEAGRIQLTPECLSASELLASVVQLHRKPAFEKQVEITVEVSDECRFVGDRKRLKQVLSSLLSNAIKFNSPSSEVSLRGFEEDRRIVFEVLDRGPGIPADRLDAIFDTFTQVDEGLARTHGGAGLGLNLVKKLTALMKGWLSLSDRPGGGTVAQVAFPLEKPVTETRGSGHGLDLSGLIVLVEDHDPTAQMLSQALKSWGFQCKRYVGRDQFLNEGCPNETKCVIMDGKLKDGSGLDCIRWLRSEESSSDLPIIFLTASEGDDLRRAGLEAGATVYLEKPIELGQLSTCLQGLIR